MVWAKECVVPGEHICLPRLGITRTTMGTCHFVMGVFVLLMLNDMVGKCWGLLDPALYLTQSERSILELTYKLAWVFFRLGLNAPVWRNRLIPG